VTRSVLGVRFSVGGRTHGLCDAILAFRHTDMATPVIAEHDPHVDNRMIVGEIDQTVAR